MIFLEKFFFGSSHRLKKIALACRRKKRLMGYFVMVAMFLPHVDIYAQETITSRYFTITFYSGTEPAVFTSKLAMANFFRLDSLPDSKNSIEKITSQGLDDLYLEVSDILDIHVRDYHGKIKVYPNREELNKEVFNGRDIVDTSLPSLYMPEGNTIYVSLKDVSLGMLAHEVAHAIISSYFVVAPPEKVQEVLAGYVEYSIRKKLGDLPR